MDRLKDPTVQKRLMESAKGKVEADILKAQLAKEGYRHQISIYGVIHNEPLDHNEYRRIEVISNLAYREQDVANIYHFFGIVKPEKTYSIWAYNAQKQEIQLRGMYV